MERSGRTRSKRDSKSRSKSPKVPIRTYRWEDVRRARRRGGYPWTYLYKGPFDEKVDLDQFTMDPYRRTKSSSPMNGVEIHEVSTYDSEVSQMSGPDIPEPNEHESKKIAREGSFVIEELPSEEEQVKKDVPHPEEEKSKHKQTLTLSKESCIESMGSTDSISQYLDKEEGAPVSSKEATGRDHEGIVRTDTNGREERAKSEEAGPRKRKLSAGSSYSRSSLSKLAVMKRLNEVKDKIKIPKISFSTKRGTKKKPSPPRETKKQTTTKPQKSSKIEITEKARTTKLRDEKPVYIHIPLKPSSGEADEFSNKESSLSNEKTSLEVLDENKTKENVENEHENATKDNLKSDEANEEHKETKKIDTSSIEPEKTPSTIEPKNLAKKPPIKINPAFKKFLKDVRKLKEKEDGSLDVKERQASEQSTKPKVVDTIAKATSDKSEVSNDKMETDAQQTPQEKEKSIMKIDKADSDSEMELDLSEQEMEEDDKENDFDKLFEAKKENKENIAIPSTSRNVRSKSVEPPTQRKRKASIDSSYSRKSLSKLAIIKKLNEAKDKIKTSLSLSNLFRKDSKSKKEEKKKPVKNKEKETKKDKGGKPGDLVKLTKNAPAKDVKPVYIHIPLKPPEGHTDEFSHFEFEPKSEDVGGGTVGEVEETNGHQQPTTVTVMEETLSVGTPDSVTVTSDIQIIFLTPPSDDETLDEKSPDIPETPSSDDVKFFSGKIGELKKLAQHVVDEYSPEAMKHHLETVSEESPSDRSSVNEEVLDNKEQTTDATPRKTIEETIEDQADKKQEDVAIDQDIDKEKETENPAEKMQVDEEDGLNEPTNKHDELKSSLKGNETTTSPVMKKKVSFKRKAKTKLIADTGDYEEIQAPKEEQELATTKDNAESKEEIEKFLTQSMSVDEETAYLDKKIVKDTSLEEDYNKWSKKDDHEYEPVNPPQEVTVLTSTHQPLPTVKIIDTEIDPGPRVVLEATKILNNSPPLVEEPTRKPIFHFHSEEHLEETKAQQPAQENIPKPASGPNKFQVAFKHKTDQLKQKTDQLKTRLQNVKKPQFHKPEFKKPDFKKFKIQKPNINLPKIPDTVQINLPFNLSKSKQTKHITTTTTTVSSKGSKPRFSFSTGRSSRSSLKDRQASTESNAGDEKKPVFDFSTFPKFMRKKAKPDVEPSFATLPKQKQKETKAKTDESFSTQQSSGGDSVRVPLHSEDSMESRNGEILNGLEHHQQQEEPEPEMTFQKMPPRKDRYANDVDFDEEFEKENREINLADRSRWQHGSFKTDENDILRYQPQQEDEEDHNLEHKQLNRPIDRYVNTERLRLEELENEDNRAKYEEYFGHKRNHELITDLDNLDDNAEDIKSQSHSKDGYSSEGSAGPHRRGILGKIDVDSDEFFVVHEIHEGMKTPANTLLMNEYDPVGSNKSLQEAVAKSKKHPIKKPKRKKTPHVSQEQIPYDEESVDDTMGLPPSRPKRRSKKRNKRPEDEDSMIPYQETISLEEEAHDNKRLEFPRESLGILGDDEEDFEMYVNEKMRGKEQPNILVTDPYKHYEFERRLQELQQQVQTQPEAPPRRHRSLKSLTISENESISEITKRYMDDDDIVNKYIDDDISFDASHIEDLIIPTTSFQQAPPKRPSRRSRSQGSSVSRTSLPPSSRDEGSILDTESYTLEGRVPCSEEPCSQEMRDYMGYAIVDKQKMPREPPLPPPRCTTGPRKKRQIPQDQKFSTVPRNHGSEVNQPPVRPLRNYSTLSQMQGSKSSGPPSKEDTFYENQHDDKENNLQGYESMEDESTRTLQSEPIIQKMRERPLPAPPRPPRKTRTFRTSLKDITSKDNIMNNDKENQPYRDKTDHVVEETVSTQTATLPNNFSREKDSTQEGGVVVESTQPTAVRRELITPTHYSFEETITHGSLLIEPLNGAQILPDSQLIKERRVPIIRAEDDDEPSEPPESFKNLKNPETPQSSESKAPKPTGSPSQQQIHIVKTDKLQVGDLDVDRLRVNQLLASKIVVSEIDSDSIKVNDIQAPPGQSFSSKDISLPPEFVQEIIKELQRRSEAPQTSTQDTQESTTLEEKKTPIEPRQTVLEYSPPPPAFSEIESFKVSDNRQEPISELENLDISKLSAKEAVAGDLGEHAEKEIEINLESSVKGNVDHTESLGSIENVKDNSECKTDEVLNLNTENPAVPVDTISTPTDLQNNSEDPPSPPSRGGHPNETETQQSALNTEGHLEPPQRPARMSRLREGSRSSGESPLSRQESRSQMLEPEIDDQPPPRPPQPPEDYYLPSQPPASFYALRAQEFVDDLEANIPTVPRRKRTSHQKSRPLTRSKSTSEDSLSPPRAPRLVRHTSEPSIPELTGRLAAACGSHIQSSIKRLIHHFNENVFQNVDGQQDMHVCIIILLVLIAGLILLGQNEDKTIIHHHHWEYFNPPKDL